MKTTALKPCFQKHPESRDEYKAGLASFEESLNSSSAYSFKKDGRIKVPGWIHSKETHETKETEYGPVWWPESALKRHKVSYAESDLVAKTGKKELGLLRDRSEGVATGAIELAAAEGRQLERSRAVANNSMKVEDGATAACWAELKQATGTASGVFNDSGKCIGVEAPGTIGGLSQDSWSDVLPGFNDFVQSTEATGDDGGCSKGHSKEKAQRRRRRSRRPQVVPAP